VSHSFVPNLYGHMAKYRHSVATAGGPVQVSKEAKRQTVITFEYIYMTYEYKNDHVAHESAAVSSMWKQKALKGTW